MSLIWTENDLKIARSILAKYPLYHFREALTEIQKLVNHSVTSGSLRAAFARNNLHAPSSYCRELDSTEEEILDESERKNEEEEDIDPVALHEEREELSRDKRTIKNLVRDLREARERQKFLDACSSYKAPPCIMPLEKSSGKRELTAVVLASDWHVEEPVEPEAVAYRNEYNLEIADQRVKRFFEGVIWNIEHNRASKRLLIRNLVLWLGGDLMSGYIHPELVESNLLSPTETVRWLIPRLRDGIYTLLKVLDLDHIEIPCSHGNHGRCHDVETEILTYNGWKKYNEIKVGDLVATYTMNEGTTKWQPLLDVYVNETYEGPMVKVNTMTADFMVTPHHRMVLEDHGSEEYFEEMQESVKRGTFGLRTFPKCALGSDTEYPEVSDDELRLLGWIITDGQYATVKEHTEIRIHQSKVTGITVIQDILVRLGIGFSVSERVRPPPVICGVQVKKALPESTFYIQKSSSSRLLQLLPDKYTIPSWMNRLSTRQFNVFLEGLLAGDGHVRDRADTRRQEERVLYGRQHVLDQIQMLAVTHGIAARVREDKRGDFILSLPTTKRGYINDWSKSVSIEQYSGVIWCGTVDAGTLITRRNGIPLVSGNTTEKPRVSTSAQNNFEHLLYWSLADEFRSEPRVHFEITASSHQYVQVYDSIIHFHHGDDVKYMGGVGGLGIPLLKAVPSWDLVRKADLHCIGHHHTFRDFGRAIVNGSLIGYGPYSQRIRAEFEVPQQAMFYIDSKRGKCMVSAIWVSEMHEHEGTRGKVVNISDYRL